MHSPPRLRLGICCSRTGRAAVAAGALTVGALMLALPLDPWFTFGAVTVAFGWALRTLRTCVGIGVPALIVVGLDRRLTLVACEGRSLDGDILDDSYVGASITTIVWRPDQARWYAPARSIVILPDGVGADEFRQLRVMLRYGRPSVGQQTSGRDAG